MSTLYVDNLQPNLGSQVEIPDLKPLAGQVVQTETLSRARTARQTISSTSYVAVNDGNGAFEVTITPKFSSSKILGMFTIGGIATTSNATSLAFSVYRNGSEVLSIDSHFGYNYDEHSSRLIFSPVFTDLPSSTSACTYTVYTRIQSSGQTAYIFDTHIRNDNTATFILQEIAQ
jgi:hypothetical protein